MLLEAAQAVADGTLGEAERGGGPRHAPVPQHGIERDETGEGGKRRIGLILSP